jgi:hypothetical protein
MSEAREPRTGLWVAVGAIGGIMSGVAAVLGLFLASPNTINILIPAQTLQQAGLVLVTQQATDPAPAQQQQTPPIAVENTFGSAATSPQPASIAQQPIAPARTLAPGLEAALLSLTEQRDRYVATFRFTNGSARELGVAVLDGGFARAEFYLSDGVGGSCQMAANGEGWGSLDAEAAEAPSWQQRGEFRTIPIGGTTQHSIFFNKGRCDTPVNGIVALAISGSFVIESAGQRSVAAISFDQLRLSQQ